MFRFSQVGIATITIGVAIVAVAGSTTGVPVAVDQVDTQPNSHFYPLERAGEQLKEPVMGGQNWEIDRGQERTNEFAFIARVGKAKGHTQLIEEAKRHFFRAAKLSKDNRGLERAMNALRNHVRTLENVRKEVPEAAKPALSLAIEQSTRFYGVLDNIASKGGLGPGEKLSKQLKDNLKKQLEDVKENVSAHQKKVQESLKENVPVENVLREIENKTPKLGKKIGGPKIENKPSGDEGVSASGVLEKPEVTSFMYGTHILVSSENQELIYALKSANINLDNFVAESVDIEGTKIHSGLDGGPPLVNVETIDIIQGGSGGGEDQQRGSSSPPFEPKDNQAGPKNPT